MAFVLSLALFAAALVWAAKVATTHSERRWASVAAMIPLAVTAGTLRQLVHRQWKARRRAKSED